MANEAICFKFYQVVKLIETNQFQEGRKGLIRGKIKDADCYVVSFIDGDAIKRDLTLKFGSLIRHLELEWGAFKGTDAEFIVPSQYLELEK